MPFPNGYIDSNGIKLYYEIEGEGEPLILLSGGPGLDHTYLQEMRALAPFARLVFYDQRGTGRSDKAPLETYTIAANVDDLENLRRELGLGKVGLLGHSWGGMLAQEYAVKYPASLSRLILADTFSSFADVSAAMERLLAGVPADIRAVYEKHEQAGLYREGDHYPEEYQRALEVAYAAVFGGFDPPAYLQNTFARVAGDVYRTMWGEESEFRVTGTLAAFDVAARLGQVRVPTLVIVGARDMPTVEMARTTARLIPNASLAVFERSHHFPFIEEKAAFVRVVSEFLKTSRYDFATVDDPMMPGGIGGGCVPP